jgi:glycosyltransferase involved in cell wall biosynthesis
MLLHVVFDASNIPESSEVLSSLDVNEECNDNFHSKCLLWPKGSPFPGHYLKESITYSNLLYSEFKTSNYKPDAIVAKGFCAFSFVNRQEFKNTPIFSNIHGYEMYQHDINFKGFLRNRMLRVLSNRIISKSDYVISYGGGITRLLERVGVQKERIIENPSGIEKHWLRQSTIVSKEVVNILYLGRYERRKGIEEINKAIKEPILGLNFYFIGPIPENSKILDRSDIHYLGIIMDGKLIKEHLDNMDVLLCPSYSEGMPNVIMEAMSRGLAIITTNVGAIELLVDDQNGWIIKVGSSEAIQNTLIKVAQLNSELLLEKRMNSIKKINSFVWPSPARQLIAKIEEKLLF